MSTTKARTVNTMELAAILGVHRHTVNTMVSRGCPIEKKGAKGSEACYNTSAVIKWISEQEVKKHVRSDDGQLTHEQLRCKKLENEVRLQEVAIAIAEGDVCTIDEATSQWAGALIVLAQRMLNVPQRVAPMIMGETDETIVKKIIYTEIADAMSEHNNSLEELDDYEDEEVEPEVVEPEVEEDFSHLD